MKTVVIYKSKSGYTKISSNNSVFLLGFDFENCVASFKNEMCDWENVTPFIFL